MSTEGDEMPGELLCFGVSRDPSPDVVGDASVPACRGCNSWGRVPTRRDLKRFVKDLDNLR